MRLRHFIFLLLNLSLLSTTAWGGSEPFWIWLAGKQAKAEELHARRTFHIANRVRSAELLVAKDSTARLFLNGAGLRAQGGRIDVTSRLRLGRNVLAVHTRTRRQRGFIALLVVTLKSGRTQVVATDREWKTAVGRQPEWTALDFDDSRWSAAATLAPHGAPPWGEVLGGD